jgi:hypothetical protein
MSMKYISTEVEVGLDEWTDLELIEEVKYRGYKVEEEDEDMTEVQWRWRRGDKKEALILLEREFKWLRGISQLVN